MNYNTISFAGASAPVPFKVATSTYKTVTTPAAFTYTTTSGPVMVGPPLVTAILGSSSPQDPNANGAILMDNLGGLAGNRGASRPYYNASSFDGVPFRIRASGTSHVVASASASGASFRVSLYLGTSATASSDVLVPATNATVINVPASKTANLNFMVQADLIWDSTSLQIVGTYFAAFGGYNVTDTAVITPVVTLPAGTNTTALTAANYDALSFIPFIDWTVNAPTSASTVLTELTFNRL